MITDLVYLNSIVYVFGTINVVNRTMDLKGYIIGSISMLCVYLLYIIEYKISFIKLELLHELLLILFIDLDLYITQILVIIVFEFII